VITEYQHLLLAEPDLSDLRQEAELLKLTGVQKPSLRLLYQRAKRQEALLFDDWLPATAQPVQWSSHVALPSSEDIQRLVSWAIEQEATISEAIFDFLEDPDDTKLPALISRLRKAGAIPKAPQPKKPARHSLAGFILRRLEEGQATLDNLYEAVRLIHTSARPEAAVRQVLRRLIRQGKVQSDGNSYWV
jgi:hypothetical protein